MNSPSISNPPPVTEGRVKRADYDAIISMIPIESRVLDLGCGDGELMELLRERKSCRVFGVELDKNLARQAVSRGLSVLEADIDEGLKEFPGDSFDIVVLSQTLQVTKRPHLVLKEMLRVGNTGIVSTPNFAHWEVRLQIALKGRMPRTRVLPYTWYETPNIHMVTVEDFRRFCRREGLTISKEIFLGLGRRPIRFMPNLLARTAIFAIGH